MNSETREIVNITKKGRFIYSITLIKEEPLSIRVEGQPYMTTMRTPGNEKSHVAGICLAEGIVDKKEDLSSIGFCKGNDENIVTVTLTQKRRSLMPDLAKHANYTSNTSCGICGKITVEEIIGNKLKPIKENFLAKTSKITKTLLQLNNYQPIREKTRATHCSVIFDKNWNFLSSAEDIGRHNAMDKSIGELLLNGNLHKAKIIFLSSRISYELVQKTARAKIPILAAISRPSHLAVELSTKLNIALVTLSPDNGLMVHSNSHRLI